MKKNYNIFPSALAKILRFQRLEVAVLENRRIALKRLAVFAALAVVLIGLPAMWHALKLDGNGSTDYLAYFGALLGAGATIVAVGWEIKADGTARKREYELDHQPIIWCGKDNDFKTRNAPAMALLGECEEVIEEQGRNALIDWKDDDDKDRYAIVLNKQNGEYHRSYEEKIDEALSFQIHNETYIKKEGGGISECGSRYLVIPLIMKNVGVGPALSLCEGTRFPNEVTGMCCKPPRLLGVGDSFRFVLCVDNRYRWDYNDRFDITASYLTITGEYLRYALEVIIESDSSGYPSDYKLAKQGRTEVVE